MVKQQRRISKKEIKQDELLEFLYKGERFVRRNTKLLSYVGIGIVAVVVIGLLMYNSRQNAEQQMAAALGAAQPLFDQQNYEQVIQELEPAVNQYSGTENAGIGVFYIASSHFRLEEYEQAKEYYQEYLNKYDNDPVLGAAAQAALGDIARHGGNPGDAMEYYRKASRRAPHKFLVQKYSLEAARSAIGAGETQQARKLLTGLLESEEIQSGYRTEAKELMASLQVHQAIE